MDAGMDSYDSPPVLTSSTLVPIPWDTFEYRDLWVLEYETNSENTWNAIPSDLQRKIVRRLKKSVTGEGTSGRGGGRRIPVKWEELDKPAQELWLERNPGATSENWMELAPKVQRKERDKLNRALVKMNKKQEQEMRKKARLTPDLLNAWLSEERTLIEWLNLPTETKLFEMNRLNQKLSKSGPKETETTPGLKRRRGRPFGATSSSKRAKAMARDALADKANETFHAIANYQQDTKVAGVEKDNMMVLIHAYKGNDKKGRGRPRKDDLHNRLIFRIYGASLSDMKMLLKQAYHQVKNELDVLNNEADINPQVKLAKHEILFEPKDIDKSFAQQKARAAALAAAQAAAASAAAAAAAAAAAGVPSENQESVPEQPPEPTDVVMQQDNDQHQQEQQQLFLPGQ